MKQFALPFHPEAEVELFEALDYYDELDWLQDTELAQDLLRSIELALEEVEAAPHGCPPYLFGTRRFLLRRFPYAVVFDTDPELVVLAFAHTKRRPGYWRARQATGR